MRLLTPTDLDKELAPAIHNAERQLQKKFSKDDAFDNFDIFFKAWIRSYWGITIGETRVQHTYSPDGDSMKMRYWPIEAVQSDEHLVMFKLTYG